MVKSGCTVIRITRIKPPCWLPVTMDAVKAPKDGKAMVRILPIPMKPGLPLSDRIINEGFLSSLAHCRGVLCGAGIETPAEALFLGKKLMVIPMFNHYEQLCNAASLKEIGVPVVKKLNKRYYGQIQDWLDSDSKIEIHYPNHTENTINPIFELYVNQILQKNKRDNDYALIFPTKDKKVNKKANFKFFSKKVDI